MVRRLVWLVVLGLAFSLAGCGGSPSADPSRTPTSPTPSASPSAPVLPQAAKANTKAGAVAFAKHYIDLINHAQATGDTRALAAVERAHCESCQDARRGVDAVYQHGGSLKGGLTAVQTVIDVAPNAAIHGYEVDLQVKYGAQTVIRPSRPPKHYPGGRMVISIQIARATAGWVVDQWTRA